MRATFFSAGSGRLLRILSTNSSVMGCGGMSVSGYILAAPGLGRIYRVVPSSFAVRVSAGTPVNEFLCTFNDGF